MNFRSKNTKLRECDNHRQSAYTFLRGRRSLPLPGGEGRGEGERRHIPFIMCGAVQTEQEPRP